MRIFQALRELSRDLQIIFPIHPRTQKRLAEFGVSLPAESQFRLIEPLGYLQFLALQSKATVVVTDSGGIQEEATFLQVPCLTLRENTERPVTVNLGSNTLVGYDMSRLKSETARILQGQGKRGQRPPLWDGKASERIADVLAKAI